MHDDSESHGEVDIPNDKEFEVPYNSGENPQHEDVEDELRFAHRLNDELAAQLNQRNSDNQILTEEKKQLEGKITELEGKVNELEQEKQQFLLNQENWATQYNLTMELLYQHAFNLMSLYNGRRLSRLPAENDARFGSV